MYYKLCIENNEITKYIITNATYTEIILGNDLCP